MLEYLEGWLRDWDSKPQASYASCVISFLTFILTRGVRI
jgi:hypothetical protein